MNRQARDAISPIPFHGIQQIVSGGQTGVDRAALDVAISLGIHHGGWCPKGRMCETGIIDSKYQLSELDQPGYSARTLQNVKDSDGTLILYVEQLRGGTALTNHFAKQQRKPVFRARIDTSIDLARIVDWLGEHKIRILNVAGPRASSHPGVEQIAREVLMKLFQTPPGLFAE